MDNFLNVSSFVFSSFTHIADFFRDFVDVADVELKHCLEGGSVVEVCVEGGIADITFLSDFLFTVFKPPKKNRF